MRKMRTLAVAFAAFFLLGAAPPAPIDEGASDLSVVVSHGGCPACETPFEDEQACDGRRPACASLLGSREPCLKRAPDGGRELADLARVVAARDACGSEGRSEGPCRSCDG